MTALPFPLLCIAIVSLSIFAWPLLAFLGACICCFIKPLLILLFPSLHGNETTGFCGKAILNGGRDAAEGCQDDAFCLCSELKT